MSAAAFALLFTGVLLNAAAQLFLKAGTNATGVITLTPSDGLATILRLATVPPILAGLACYAVSVVVWILGLSRVPVSVAYPMLSLGYVVNAVAAQWLFGEAVSVQRWLGIGFIVLGVFVVARSA
ncbi:MAG: EamA family transporter [Burkholderiales bacterium]|jgi:multidrug transporter EmrE-like cation transporter|nr:EamA family transporter [Burkholderiales bacterium]